MPEVALIIGLILLVLAFAVFGFIRFVIWLFGSHDKKTESPPPNARRSLDDDVKGASHLINYLHQQERIDDQMYGRIRDFLEKEFSDKELARPVYIPGKPLAELRPEKSVIDEEGQLHEVGETATTRESESLSSEQTHKPADASETPPVIVSPIEIISPSPADENKPVRAAHDVASAKPTPAPWDMPDPPALELKRSFSEMMTGFMLEKNIRWGELASGILIVGSAVGLVVSLRNELRDTIPYFSALLFMLMTAAIHGSGIYTLKKWKLRATSRGALLIGLLLVPLNFVAACVLSGNEGDRRELTDPLLWTAVGIGLTSFSAMTWYSSQCLFRRGQLPLVLAIMGCAIGTLVINRAQSIGTSSIRMLLLSIPLAVSFLIGTAAFYKRQWVRVRWPDRASNRVFIFLGLSTFAFLVASSLLVVRASDKQAAVVSLLPAFSLATLMTAWLGRIIWKGAGGVEKKRIRMTGLALHILGLTLMAVSLVASTSNPTMLLINSVVAFIGLLLFAKQQAEPRLLPFAWAAFAAFVLCAVNLLVGKFEWDQWAAATDLIEAVVSGKSGLSLLATGAAVAGIHALYRSRAAQQTRFQRVGWLSGAAIFLAGCLLALAASFVDRANTFDNMVATSLLGLASLLSLGVCSRRLPADGAGTIDPSFLAKSMTHGAAGITLGFLAHAFVWNRSIADQLDAWLFNIDANWSLVFVSHSILIAIVAAFTRRTIVQPNAAEKSAVKSKNPVADLLGEWSSVTNVVGLVGAFFLIRHHTGVATGIAIVLAVVWLVLVWVQSNHRFGPRYWVSWLVGSTSVATCISISELATQQPWCPTLMTIESIPIDTDLDVSHRTQYLCGRLIHFLN